ncbi:adenylate/guanylate cyclase domain-containing response regulator [Hymenobacter qilianensis]|uniref:Adenylate/guanylate cyclase domain-containing response regulator n=2 Tax=Hymenobacter qilianensis TaxID=1385715 RepID=A0ACB5PW09_9BACT|nr:adenylate/guanylate cyclase domain-containing protein [Hymenobacter qilianensis]QNP51215.1 response regulator [Hymenobacter qilianensis]GGF77322.1 adenylate/guanylate cyclase domain-containing response regulator [Hymenobacter qilianensis]
MKTKILVVDDEADLELLIKQKFRRKIRENQYEFLFASNGQEALTRVAENPDTDIILSDINMPVMDGLTMLTKLHEAHTAIKTVMVSAYGDMQNIRTAMNRGAFDFVCKPVDFNDLELTIEKTIAQVKQLRETLQAIQENNILKMYVDETVLNFMARPDFENKLLASESIEATVVFIDICGFTSLSEVLPPGDVVNMLNTYFDQMVREIIAHSGYIDKFMGDAVMAVFRGEYHLDRAIDAALSVRSLIAASPGTLPDGSAYQPQVSIGINTGEMVSGNIGSASLKRLDYTVIGDTVNVSQRLQGAAQPGQIIVTEATYNKIKESFQCQQVGEVSLKNKSKPIMTYEVVA